MKPGDDRRAARLFHLQSSNSRAILPDLDVNQDERPARWRTYPGAQRYDLPGRDFELSTPIGRILKERRSIRSYHLTKLSLEKLGRLLHSSYGVIGNQQLEGEWVYLRPSPSAGGLAPIELYIAIQQVEGLPDGLYHYDPRAHQLELRATGVFHSQLAAMTLGQEMLKEANLVLILTAVFERTMWKYGPRGYRYVWLDAGHLGQNLYLAATAIGLGPVAIGGFFDKEVAELLTLASDEEPIYLFCVGQCK